jgi:hypothetical protein
VPARPARIQAHRAPEADFVFQTDGARGQAQNGVADLTDAEDDAGDGTGNALDVERSARVVEVVQGLRRGARRLRAARGGEGDPRQVQAPVAGGEPLGDVEPKE